MLPAHVELNNDHEDTSPKGRKRCSAAPPLTVRLFIRTPWNLEVCFRLDSIVPLQSTGMKSGSETCLMYLQHPTKDKDRATTVLDLSFRSLVQTKPRKIPQSQYHEPKTYRSRAASSSTSAASSSSSSAAYSSRGKLVLAASRPRAQIAVLGRGREGIEEVR